MLFVRETRGHCERNRVNDMEPSCCFVSKDYLMPLWGELENKCQYLIHNDTYAYNIIIIKMVNEFPNAGGTATKSMTICNYQTI